MEFPAPLEVDRELYTTTKTAKFAGIQFPAPREVDRELYNAHKKERESSFLFSPPREVDRDLYEFLKDLSGSTPEEFPAPLEVDRELYVISMFIIGALKSCSRPLSR